MSSGRNYSGSQLRRILIARHHTFFQLHGGRFTAQRTRLLQRPDQTDVLTTEQQDLKVRVLVVHCAFATASDLLVTVKVLLDYYDEQQNAQPQPSNQVTALIVDEINALIAELGLKLQNLECRLRELEGIDVTDAQ